MDQRAQARPLRGGVLRSDERGIMIVEVVVSAIILVVMALATLAILDRSSALSADNRARSVATGLAQQDQDMVRQWPFSRIDGMFGASNALGEKRPARNAPREEVIDGMKYAVETELEVVVDNNNDNTACLAGWQNRKIQITTTATPPSGNRIKPVVMRTFRVPTITDQADKGGVIVRLNRGNGDPTVGVPVRATGKSQVNTDDDGCAVFNDVTTGSVTVEWGTAGGPKVDENGADLVTRTFTLLKGSTAQFSGRFDDGKNPAISFVDEDGDPTTADGAPIRWNSVSTVNSGISTVYNGWRSWRFSSATGFTIPKLFPFETPYGVFAGTCWGNDPTVWEAPSVATNSLLLNGTAPNSGNVVMRTVRFNFSPGAQGYRVFVAPERRVTKMGTGKCTPGADSIMDGIYPSDAPDDREAAPFKTTGVGLTPAGRIEYALPFGIWRVCVDNVSTNRYTKKTIRINNTPPGTPGSLSEVDEYARGIYPFSAPASNEPPTANLTAADFAGANGGAGLCSANPDTSLWLNYNHKVNPTDK